MTTKIIGKSYSYGDRVEIGSEQSRCPFHIRPLQLKTSGKNIKALSLKANELINAVNFFNPKKENERSNILKLHADVSKLSSELTKTNQYNPVLLEVNKKLLAVEWILQTFKSPKIEAQVPKPSKIANDSTSLRLSEMTGTKQIVEGLKQIPVLQQSTESESLQACGLHSLKNSLVTLFVQKNGATGAYLFTDEELYTVFYNTYCKPILAQFKQKDASAAVVRQIYENFMLDTTPPKALQEIHKALLASPPHSILLFNVATREQDSGDRSFGTMDVFGVNDALKLYQFSKTPGPSFITCLCGDESEGHWMTLIIEKDKSGTITFKGCDSMGESIAGDLAPLAKLKQLFEKTLKQPDAFLKHCYANMNDLIERTASWVSDENPSYQQKLLDGTPNELLKTKHCDGSTKQITIDHLLKSYHLIKLCNWFKEPDINIQLSLLRLEQTLQFYADNLSKTDPQYKSIKKALKDISSKRIKNFVQELCTRELAILKERQEKSSEKLPPVKFQMLLDMLGFISVSFEFRKEISAGKDKQERLNLANTIGSEKLGKGIGLEELSGTSSKEVEKNTEEAAYAFLKGYQYIKEVGKLPQLCEKLTTPCMSGKLLATTQFVDELILGLSEESTSTKEKVYLMPQAAIAESIEECILNDNNDGEEDTFISGLKHSIFENPEYQTDLAQRLNRLSSLESAESFTQFLKDRNIWENGDWEKIVPKLIKQEEFSTMFAQGKAQALASV